MTLKKLLYKLLFFAVMLVVIDKSFGWLARKTNLYNYSTETGSVYYKLFHVTPDVLLLGSSRAGHHYNPAIMDTMLQLRVFNGGEDGSDIYYQQLIGKIISGRFTPKLIVLDIRPDELNKPPRYYFLKSLYPFAGISSDIRNESTNVDPFARIKLWSDLYCYNSKLLPCVAGYCRRKPVDTATLNGYIPLEPKPGVQLKFEKLVYPPFDKTEEAYFQSFLQYCKQKRIKIVVVISPYYAIIPGELTQRISNNCQKKDVPFYDYTSDTAYLNHPELFSDENHLNRFGAEQFTREVTTRLKPFVSVL